MELEQNEMEFKLDSLMYKLYPIIKELNKLEISTKFYFESVELSVYDKMRFKDEISDLFKNGIPKKYLDYKINNRYGASLKLEKLDFSSLLECSFISIFRETILNLIDTIDKKELEAVSLNIINNYRKIHIPGFIEKYESQLLNQLAYKQIPNGSIFYTKTNNQTLRTTLQIFNILKSLNKKYTDSLVSSIKNLHYRFDYIFELNYMYNLSNLLKSIEFEGDTTKQLIADVNYIILDIAGYENLRDKKIENFETEKEYMNYRLYKTKSILNPKKIKRQFMF